MCCCDKPTVNGELGYKWRPNDSASVRQPFSPVPLDGDVLLYDEPGRCGGIDSHCHHYRLVQGSGSFVLLVHHGRGDERIRISNSKAVAGVLEKLDSNARYWILNAIYRAHNDGDESGVETANHRWRKAAREGRIKTRKRRGQDIVDVTIDSEITRSASS